MSAPIQIVGLGGSLSGSSSSLYALNVALGAARQAGAGVHLLDVRELNLPMYVPDPDPLPAAVEQLRDVVRRADGMLWSSPLYHGTISGAFKNALDWLEVMAGDDPPYLTDKVIGLISAAGGSQGLQAINTMEFVVRALRGWAVPLVIPISQSWKAFDENGQPLQPALAGQLKALGEEVVRASRNFRGASMTSADAASAEAGQS